MKSESVDREPKYSFDKKTETSSSYLLIKETDKRSNVFLLYPYSFLLLEFNF